MAKDEVGGLCQMHPLLRALGTHHHHRCHRGRWICTLAWCYVQGFEWNLLCFPFTFAGTLFLPFFHYYLCLICISSAPFRASWFQFRSWHALLPAPGKGHPSSCQCRAHCALCSALCASASLHRFLCRTRTSAPESAASFKVYSATSSEKLSQLFWAAPAARFELEKNTKCHFRFRQLLPQEQSERQNWSTREYDLKTNRRCSHVKGLSKRNKWGLWKNFPLN